MRHAGHRLDVVHDRRLAERAFDGRERRLDARPGALAFQALDQSRFLAADVRSRSAMQEYIEVKVLAEDVPAEQIVVVQLIDGLLQHAIAAAVLVAQIEIRRAGARRIAGRE